MKKIIQIVIAFLFTVSLLPTGCSNASLPNIAGVDLIKYNHQGSNNFGFNLNLITPNKNADIEFVSFYGENTQDLSVRFTDDTYDYLQSLKHNGYYIKLLGFTCYTNDTRVVIEGVELKVDGEKNTYSLTVPIVHYNQRATGDSPIQFYIHPAIIATNSYSTTKYVFEYQAEERLAITDFSFNDFFVMKEAVVAIDGTIVGQLQDVLPLDIPANSHFSVIGYFGFKDDSVSSSYDSVYCDVQLSYLINRDLSTGTVIHYLVSQSVSNDVDAKNAIDLLRPREANALT